jgi:thymidylate synthase (FAD)
LKKEKVYIYPNEKEKIGCVEYVDHMGSDKDIVNAARASVGKESKKPFSEKDRELMKYLIENKHTSPFEHVKLKCRFTVPLFVRSQHMRHRLWNFNELSRRFTDKDIQFYLPKSFRTQHENNIQASNNDSINPKIHTCVSMGESKLADLLVESTTNKCFIAYQKLLDANITREQARMILPQNLYTTYIGTCDLHNLFHFLSLRLGEHAQYEIRVVAEALLYYCEQLFPEATSLFKEVRLDDI